MRKTTKKKRIASTRIQIPIPMQIYTFARSSTWLWKMLTERKKKREVALAIFGNIFSCIADCIVFAIFFSFQLVFFFFWVRALISPNFGYALFCDCEFLCLFSHFLVIVRVSSLTFVRSVRASLFFFGDLRPTKCCCLAVCNFCACRWSLSGRKKKIVRGSLNPLIWGLWGVGKFNRLANFFYGSPSLYSALSLRFRHRNRQLLIMDRIWLKGW